MKLLLDLNISYKVIKRINRIYGEVDQIGRLGMSQMDDAMIFQFARTNGYTIITFDAYFHERNLLANSSIKVIWLKLSNTSTENIINILRDNRKEIKAFINDESFTCLEITDE